MRLVVVGGGGHASGVLAIQRENSERWGGPRCVEGFLDDSERSFLDELGVTRLGAISERGHCAGHYVLGLGMPTVRQRLAPLMDARFDAAVEAAVHRTAVVAERVALGRGVTVYAGSVIGALVTVGDHAHISANTIVGHGSVIGAFSSVMPSANLGGDVTVGEASEIGMGATVLPRITVGSGAVVGAGAVVTRDVRPGATVVGVPAREVPGA